MITLIKKLGFVCLIYFFSTFMLFIIPGLVHMFFSILFPVKIVNDKFDRSWAFMLMQMFGSFQSIALFIYVLNLVYRDKYIRQEAKFYAGCALFFLCWVFICIAYELGWVILKYSMYRNI